MGGKVLPAEYAHPIYKLSLANVPQNSLNSATTKQSRCDTIDFDTDTEGKLIRGEAID